MITSVKTSLKTGIVTCVLLLLLTSFKQDRGVGTEEIKIGFLFQDSKFSEASNGAQMAIDQANKNGGYNGKKFRLVTRSMEGPWGTGSKQAVSMIFDENVVAIAGSHDGRNAHLVEQATTKSHIAFVSCYAGDPTLSQAFTPWFFNIIPNDNQQAELLVKEIFVNKKFKSVSAITDDDYDASSAYKSFKRISDVHGFKLMNVYNLKDFGGNFKKTADALTANSEAVLIFTGVANAEGIIKELNSYSKKVPVYGPHFLLDRFASGISDKNIRNNLLLLTSGDWYKEINSEFSTEYRDIYGSYPTASSAYSYDAINIIIEALKTSGGVKENVYRTLLDSDHKGVTGRIRFDEKGNRIINND